MGYKSPRQYSICLQAQTSMNPSDATTLYIGGVSPDISTSSTRTKTFIPINGFVRVASLYINSATVNGTNEDWIFSLYDGTVTTDIATVGLSAAERVWENYNMNYKVTAGGYIQLKTTTPTWVTNPEGCRAYCILIVESE